MDLIAGLGGQAPAVQSTQLLLSPALQDKAGLAALNWHVDARADARNRLPGIQAFFLIDDVAPGGGATLALAGSHRTAMQSVIRSPAFRRVLKASADPEHELRAFGITLVEMSGRAGDVFLMDMRVMHSPSIDTTKNVRMMATCRCHLDL